MGKIISAKEAVAKIKDGDCICVGGFVGMGHPEALTSALEERFLSTGRPAGTQNGQAGSRCKDRGI